jgi:membrane fusion protein (multidrug efflux system)
MFLEARLETARRPEAVVVPEDAVSPMGGALWIWVVADGKADRREVTLGVRTPGYVEVRSGISEGDAVVVGGAERLIPGAEVRATVQERRPPAGREPVASDSSRKAPEP